MRQPAWPRGHDRPGSLLHEASRESGPLVIHRPATLGLTGPAAASAGRRAGGAVPRPTGIPCRHVLQLLDPAVVAQPEAEANSVLSSNREFEHSGPRVLHVRLYRPFPARRHRSSEHC